VAAAKTAAGMPLRRLVPPALLVASLLPSIRSAAPVWAAGPQSPEQGRGRGDLLGNLNFTSERGPVTIGARELEFDYRTRTLTYRGEVVVTQGDLTLTSDLLRVTLDEAARDAIREVVAEGNVRVTQGARMASGGRAVFDQQRRTVVLTEDAILRDGPNEVAGERVVVYLEEQRSVVEGGQRRVKAVLFPSGGAEKTPEKADHDG
jgi:lipopolysaccharide export system protein LptA